MGNIYEDEGKLETCVEHTWEYKPRLLLRKTNEAFLRMKSWTGLSWNPTSTCVDKGTESKISMKHL